jgi:Protein of unknown function (DUF5818)
MSVSSEVRDGCRRFAEYLANAVLLQVIERARLDVGRHFSRTKLVHPIGMQASERSTFEDLHFGGCMRNLLLFSVLLLGASWMAAQTSSGTGQSGAGQTGSDQSGYGQTAGQAGGTQKTVTGCLSQSNGQYVLTSHKGMAYQLSGDTSELANHVGHEIKVTGTESGAGASANASGQASANGPTIEVSSMKHISKTCKTAGTTDNSGGNMQH